MSIDFNKVGDVVNCKFEGGIYKQVGSLSKFTFNGKQKSRRQVRLVIKDLLKLSQEL